MKSALKWILIIITSLIFLYAFSSSYSSQNIDHLDYVIALGIDSVPNSNSLKVSFEFANLGSFSENSSSSKTEPILNSIIAPSIPNAITIMNAYIGKQVNLSHCKVIVISKNFAQNGILEEVSVLTHDIQIRPTTNVLISESEASEYLKNSTSSLEQVLTKYYAIFPTSSEYTGYTSNIPLGLFYENIINKNAGAVSILGNIIEDKKKSTDNSSKDSSSEDNTNSENNETSSNSSSENNNSTTNSVSNDSKSENSTNQNVITKNAQNNQPDYQSFDPKKVISEGDHGVENMGLAVFRDDKYVGNLSTIETLCYSLIKDEVDDFLITISDPFDESKTIDINVGDLSQIDIDVDISKDYPIISLRFNLTAEVENVITQPNLSYEETLKKIDTSLKSYLSKEFIDYLYKTSKEYKSDINEFCRIAKRKFLTNSDFENYNWAKKYENAEFKVEFNDDIISTLIIRQNE